MIKQDKLKEDLHYDTETGVFTWLITNYYYTAGNKAGNVNKRGYVVITVRGYPYLAHRLAFIYMTWVWPNNEIDHINHNKSDNRWSNLRDVTRKENSKNVKTEKRNISGVNGVSFDKQKNRWRADVCVDGHLIHLGAFNLKEDAIKIRKAANIKYGFHENH